MSRPAIPSEIKRQLRQEAGFGCCVCGHPFVEYHHIIPYAEDQHFRVEDMMVLCPNHHYLCTTKAMLEGDQRREKARPKNVVDGVVRGQLFVNNDRLRIHFCGGIAENTPKLLTLGGVDVLGAKLSEEGRVLISAVVQDPFGNVIAQLADNDWIANPSSIWDLTCSPRMATVRSGPGVISFEVDCRNDDAVQVRGRWHYGGSPVTFDARGGSYKQNIFGGISATDCGSLINIG